MKLFAIYSVKRGKNDLPCFFVYSHTTLLELLIYNYKNHFTLKNIHFTLKNIQTASDWDGFVCNQVEETTIKQVRMAKLVQQAVSAPALMARLVTILTFTNKKKNNSINLSF